MPGIKRVRFTTSHPRDFGRDIVDAIDAVPTLCDHVHLPVQSGSTVKVDAMQATLQSRTISREDRMDEGRKARNQHHNGCDRGTSGETNERDFEQTLSLLDEVGYDAVFTFKYSPRPNTPSLSMDDAIPEEEKSRRLEVPDAAPAERSRSWRWHKKYIGTRCEVMVEGQNVRRALQWMGRTTHNKDLEFQRSAQCRSEAGKLRSGPGDRKFSQLVAGRIGGIRKMFWRFPCEVEMTIRGLLMDPVSNMPIVILKDVGGETVLPIWVGVYEANAIALEMEKVNPPRPMTHDLIKNVLTGLETQVHKVVVTELKEDTFYAVIWLERGGEVISIDSRPSDALALALRVDCPIFVEDVVLKTSKLAANKADPVTTEELRKWLEGLNDEDLGKYKM